MGLADAVKAKAVLVPGGLVAQRLVTGEADLAIHQISEILAVKGATLVGPLPAEIQNYTTYTGGIAAASTQPEAAKAFLAFLGERCRQAYPGREGHGKRAELTARLIASARKVGTGFRDRPMQDKNSMASDRIRDSV
jgi:ABC-type molybdate transport system substrate-binding protein